MKKIVMKRCLVAISVVLIGGCSQQSAQSKSIGNGYKIREIDGCEYIEYENSINAANNYSYSLTHKGNCKNPIHYKK